MILWQPGIRQPGSGEIQEHSNTTFSLISPFLLNTSLTISSCYSGDPAIYTMAYYNFNYPPELNPFLDDDDSLSSAGSYNTAELPQPNFAPPPLPPCPTSSCRPSGPMHRWPDKQSLKKIVTWW